jgi:hypothetical protein
MMAPLTQEMLEKLNIEPSTREGRKLPAAVLRTLRYASCFDFITDEILAYPFLCRGGARSQHGSAGLSLADLLR